VATRSPKPENLQAAALVLEDRGSDSLLYNTQVIDYMVNSVQSGATALAWYYWSKIPELRYTTRYVANALSIATLYVGLDVGDELAPEKLPDNHPAVDLIHDFAGGQAGQSELLDRLALHLTVTGDSVAIGPKNGSGTAPAPFDTWKIYSTEEVFSRNGKTYVKLPSTAKEVQVPDNCLSVRIWRPHPRQWWDADSPVKGCFSVLRELDLLDQHVNATAVSRLAGAGLMGIPEELDLPGADMEIDGTEIDQFVKTLTQVMSTALKNPDSAAARVPIMLRGPAEFIDKIQHWDFSTKFDDQVPELRMAAIRRLALGMDVPPEVLLGSANSNSWSAWQTDESTLRVHLIPMLQLICSSLTVGWLRPMLERLPLTEAQKEQIPKLVISFDIQKLKIRQNISGDAEQAYDRFEIDGEHFRKALGYDDDAAPDNKELAKQILLALLKNPTMAQYAVDGLRDDFGLPLPKGQAQEATRVTERIDTPGSTPTPAAATSPGTTTPGKRSQDKQTSPPPVPKPSGDQSNNAVK